MSRQSSDYTDLVERDRNVVWHPYAAMGSSSEVFPVVSATGVRLKLADGQELIDGMSSWWCAIHGYNHPVLNAAVTTQLQAMSHVMFGGLTHRPAIQLAEKLVSISPVGLEKVFFSDSGSVSIEVAMKMAVQFWSAAGKPGKQKFLTVSKGYHGDTIGAMSVCDPVTGMHTLFNEMIARQYFADRPQVRYDGNWDEADISAFTRLLEQNHTRIAAVIIEPIVQGAGGMWFYHPAYLRQVRKLCDEYGVLLIVDEIATGFGRSGKMFACEHAEISPDIMCVGKALTGGYLSLAATLVTTRIAETISSNGDGTFMHGPTFMANPLACAVSLANINLLRSWPWQDKVLAMQRQMRDELELCRNYANVADVRVLGAIGVVELKSPVDLTRIAHEFVRRGVWIRPFGCLVYIMPPYIIEHEDLRQLTSTLCEIVSKI